MNREKTTLTNGSPLTWPFPFVLLEGHQFEFTYFCKSLRCRSKRAGRSLCR